MLSAMYGERKLGPLSHGGYKRIISGKLWGAAGHTGEVVIRH